LPGVVARCGCPVWLPAAHGRGGHAFDIAPIRLAFRELIDHFVVVVPKRNRC
jgi:hypothetical protein